MYFKISFITVAYFCLSWNCNIMIMKLRTITCAIIAGLMAVRGYAQQPVAPGAADTVTSEESCSGTCGCAASLTPIGVMTDHIHARGQLMVSYGYMNMNMRGNLAGATKVSDSKVYETFMMAPETMTMQMHMVMAMYGVTDRLTLMAMGGYSTGYMDMNMFVSVPGQPLGDTSMPSSSKGAADTKLWALYDFARTGSYHVVGSLGVSLPTGTTRAKGLTMKGPNERLPYNMQPGTGSVGLLPDFTWVRVSNTFSYGANAGADLKLNKNSLGYKTGNAYHATAWAAHRLLPFLSGSLRAEYLHTEKITGSDAEMDAPYYQISDPTTLTKNYGGTWANAWAGLNFHLMKPVLERFVLLMEYGMPLYQKVNGLQMAAHHSFQVGLEYSVK